MVAQAAVSSEGSSTRAERVAGKYRIFDLAEY
jgi:hypothetical protein